MSRNVLNDDINAKPFTELTPKKYSIDKDYLVTKEILGKGVNGKVFACINNISGKRYALKVNILYIFHIYLPTRA